MPLPTTKSLPGSHKEIKSLLTFYPQSHATSTLIPSENFQDYDFTRCSKIFFAFSVLQREYIMPMYEGVFGVYPAWYSKIPGSVV